MYETPKPRKPLFHPESRNDLEVFIDKNALASSIENRDLIEAISFGLDEGLDFKNDVFVSVACSLEHDDCPCYCQELLDQDAIGNFPMDLKTAENIAHFISGLLGGKRVYRG